ncbi:MAG: DUF2490 domain-containing protein [Myxococcales bacterium]|nr:DUF2490 domain-containing protein [Myxococcales bacterium]
MSRASKLMAVALGVSLPAQAAAQRMRFRSELGVEVAPARRWSVSLSQRLVLGDGIADSGRWQTLVGGGYAPTRWLAVGLGYRLSGEGAWAGPAFRHRVLGEATVTARPRRWRLSYRLRGQGFFEDEAAAIETRFYLRQRAAARWRSPWPVDASLSAELFSDLSGAQTEALHRVRFEAAVTGRWRAFALQLGWRYDAPWRGNGQPYHMPMVSLAWRWERPRHGRHDHEDEAVSALTAP